MDKLNIGLEIVKILKQNSYQAYVVGGAVRDYLLRRPIADVDITTNASPKIVASLFNVIQVEETYLSCKIKKNGVIFEVTTFRSDLTYQDHRHPVVTQVETIEEDLQRRDFTINALAMDENYQIIDLFKGQEDLRLGRIRTIGKAEKRFSEDALRVLRAVEFASRLGFVLDEEIILSFKVDYVKNLSEEYIIQMLNKIASHSSLEGLVLLCKYKLLKGFPFYQVVVDDAVQYGYTKDIYALFYTLHNFIPSNVRLSKSDIKHARAIAYFVREAFSNISLYYGNKNLILDAIPLFNHLNNKNLLKYEIEEKYRALPIKSYQEIDFDFMRIEACQRGLIINKVEQAILNGKLENENRKILKFLEKEEC